MLYSINTAVLYYVYGFSFINLFIELFHMTTPSFFSPGSLSYQYYTIF